MSPRCFVTQLLGSLPSAAENSGTADGNPLGAVDDATKKKLLSLQVLYPNEYLPALDLLDRGLVTRFVVDDGVDGIQRRGGGAAVHRMNERTELSTSANRDTPMLDSPINPSPKPELSRNPHNTIFYVRSAQQQRSSRYSTSYDTTQSYEVRLLAWNCTCPAFAFAAYPSNYADHDAQHDEMRGDEDNFGGVSLGSGMPPVCKHLLACVLVEKCKGLFGGYVTERVVGVEEAAGWAAGWGDS